MHVSVAAEGGSGKREPYTILFVSNPVLLKEDSSLAGDPVVDSPGVCQAAVEFAAGVIFGMFHGHAETFLRDLRPDVRVAIASVTDPEIELANALVDERAEYGGLLVPARDRIKTWIETHAASLLPVDVVFAVSDSTTYRRPTAWGTTDDATRGGIDFNIDGQVRTHYYYPKIPGTVALHLDNRSVEAAHEFGHAASGYQSGYVADLYSEPCVPCLNVKLGAEPANRIYGTYGGTQLKINAGAGTANSYHCERVDVTVPALMHDFNGHEWSCRHDVITARHLRNRIVAKMGR